MMLLIKKVLQIFIQCNPSTSQLYEGASKKVNVILGFKMHQEKYTFQIMRNNCFILFCVSQIPFQVLFSSWHYIRIHSDKMEQEHRIEVQIIKVTFETKEMFSLEKVKGGI